MRPQLTRAVFLLGSCLMLLCLTPPAARGQARTTMRAAAPVQVQASGKDRIVFTVGSGPTAGKLYVDAKALLGTPKSFAELAYAAQQGQQGSGAVEGVTGAGKPATLRYDIVGRDRIAVSLSTAPGGRVMLTAAQLERVAQQIERIPAYKRAADAEECCE